MNTPDSVYKLVEHFDRNIDSYHSSKYNEAQVRQEFIDPLFEALGWDVQNRQRWAEAYKEVIHEDSIRIAGKAKAPDYCFRVGGARKFFVEAKKPSVDIGRSVTPAFQVRRYAWSAKLPLSILTDFEEFSVYDCRIQPNKGDKASVARTMYYTYQDYIDNWEEIASVFSKEAILRGSFDRYSESSHRKRGTTEVDDVFLKELESWRQLLARNIALRNDGISVRELNFAVQQTIDRIVFLRICEDRGIEPYGQLRDALKAKNVYPDLVRLFKRADDRYNSGLFHFQSESGRSSDYDELTPRLTIDNKPLTDMIQNLYYPDSPYEFSVLSADILGQVYEQFLGRVIRLTPAGKAKIDEKPEVKKAGGVYYTPTFIVDYIVRETVGKFVDGKNPKTVRQFTILDPACGSGSFLIAAYQYLLNWHLDYYVNDNPEKHARGRPPRVYQAPNGDWRLTASEKKRILLDNIYGVDIDAQAVEVTKLSLLLKVLEGESDESLGTQLSLFQERILPDLHENIRCGNSLVNPDYYVQKDLTATDEDEWYRVNAFDWRNEFQSIMNRGGFDVIVGNPPYVRVHRLPKSDKEYYWAHYNTFVAKSDLYACFIERSMSLLRAGGYLSFITPNTWSSLESFTKLRRFVLRHSKVHTLVRTPKKVFKNATVRTMIFVIEKTASSSEPEDHEATIASMDLVGHTSTIHSVLQRDMLDAHLSNLLLFADPESLPLLAQCRKSGQTVGSEFEFFYGFKTADDDRFLSVERPSESYEPYVRSADIVAFAQPTATGFVDYRPQAMRDNKSTARPGDRQRFERPKVIVARMGRALVATPDLTGLFVKDAMLLLDPNDNEENLRVLSALLNSRLLQYLYQNFYATIDVLKNALLSLPLPATDDDSKEIRSHINGLVTNMQALQSMISSARSPHDVATLRRQAHAIDEAIEVEAFKLYGLDTSARQVIDKARLAADRRKKS